MFLMLGQVKYVLECAGRGVCVGALALSRL